VLTYNEVLDFHVSITEMLRGEAAFGALRNENQFNDPAPPGFEWVLAKVAVVYMSDDQGALTIDSSDFSVFTGGQRISYFDIPTAVEPEPRLSDIELYEGGTAEGWVAVIVKLDDPTPSLVFAEQFFYALHE
jgi:hypothetical protein